MLRLLEVLYAMLPVYAANMAPPFIRFWPGPNPPLSARWLGTHKTLGGVVLALIASMITTYAQQRIAWERSLLDYESWLALGLTFGAAAMAGDSLKSLIKRRLKIAPGSPWIPADQLDFVIAGLLVLAWLTPLSWSDVLAVLAISFVGDIVVNRVSYALGIRRTAW